MVRSCSFEIPQRHVLPFRLIAILLFLVTSALGQGSRSAGSSPLRISIGVPVASAQAAGVVVQIPLSAPVEPQITQLENPDRLVLDFPNSRVAAGYQRIPVGLGPVTAIRIAAFGSDFNIARVVIDLSAPSAYEIVSENGKISIRFKSAAAAAPEQIKTTQSNGAKGEKARVPVAESSNQPNSDSSLVRLSSLFVHRIQSGLIVDVALSSSVSPKLLRLSNPERIVVDFPNTALTRDRSLRTRIDTNEVELKAVRTGQFLADPPTVRVVLEVPLGENLPKVTPSATGVSFLLMAPKLEAAEISSKTPGDKPANSLPTVVQRPKNDPTESRPTVAPAQSSMNTSVLPLRIEKPPDSVLNTLDNPSTTATGIQPGKPFVTYFDGLLSIEAEHSTLADVLYEVGQKTGAKIEMPFSDGMLDRVVVKLGPGKPRDVLATMLQGSAFQYIIVDSTGGLDQVILVPKP